MFLDVVQSPVFEVYSARVDQTKGVSVRGVQTDTFAKVSKYGREFPGADSDTMMATYGFAFKAWYPYFHETCLPEVGGINGTAITIFEPSDYELIAVGRNASDSVTLKRLGCAASSAMEIAKLRLFACPVTTGCAGAS